MQFNGFLRTLPGGRVVTARSRILGAAALALAVCLGIRTGLPAEPHKSLEVEMSPHGLIEWKRGHRPALLVQVRRGDGWLSLASRYSGSTASAQAIKTANPRMANPLKDRPVRVPLEVLRADLRLQAARKLFPIDARVEIGYRHWVLDPFGERGETWEWLAAMFCGRSDRAAALRRANPELNGDGPPRGRPVLIPGAILLEAFRSLEPVVERPRPAQVPEPTPVATRVPHRTAEPSPRPTVADGEPGPTTASGVLGFGVDEQGEFAVYRLRRGEALYSAVVVRFTGQLHAAQVNETALEIARRSRIKDVTDIPIGYAIKIPLDLVLPEFLPMGNPRRVAWEQEQKELAGFLEVVHATDLSGVHVILDAGHGGKDSGAIVGGVWESTYVYDILCRTKDNLSRHTKATVWTTIRDASRGYDIPDQDHLRQDRDQFLLTNPQNNLDDSTAGVHLRWYLGNDIILDRIPKKVPASKVVFVSIHADSLHPSVRGSMIYVPSRHMRPSSYRAKTRGIDAHQEYREHPTVKLSSTFASRAEASSRYLADEIIASLHRNDLLVHPNKPVRDRVLRGRRSYVPAVLRYSLAQNAVLVECVNMANVADRKNLLDREWRERFSLALVEGIASAFNGSR